MSSSLPSARLRPFQPVEFGRYTLVFPISTGGMGEIFLARLGGAQGFEKLCVIKKILPDLAADPAFVERFVNEAKTLVKLNHGSIAQVLDMGLHGGDPYIALEYVDGKDLRKVLARRREQDESLPLSFSLYVMSRVLDALAYAHRKRDDHDREIKLVHRDVSPQNVLISYEGEVKVIDFGLAKSTLNSAKTNPSIILGKFLYMSPEQARHLRVDRRSDLYSVGICLYELISGKNPYELVPSGDLMSMVASPSLPALDIVAPDCPPRVSQVVMKALSVDPDDRYATAEEFRGKLLSALLELDPAAGPETVSGVMRESFATEHAQERRLLSSLRGGHASPPPPSTTSSKVDTAVFSLPEEMTEPPVLTPAPPPLLMPPLPTVIAPKPAAPRIEPTPLSFAPTPRARADVSPPSPGLEPTATQYALPTAPVAAPETSLEEEEASHYPPVTDVPWIDAPPSDPAINPVVQAEEAFLLQGMDVTDPRVRMPRSRADTVRTQGPLTPGAPPRMLESLKTVRTETPRGTGLPSVEAKTESRFEPARPVAPSRPARPAMTSASAPTPPPVAEGPTVIRAAPTASTSTSLVEGPTVVRPAPQPPTGARRAEPPSIDTPLEMPEVTAPPSEPPRAASHSSPSAAMNAPTEVNLPQLRLAPGRLPQRPAGLAVRKFPELARFEAGEAEDEHTQQEEPRRPGDTDPELRAQREDPSTRDTPREPPRPLPRKPGPARPAALEDSGEISAPPKRRGRAARRVVAVVVSFGVLGLLGYVVSQLYRSGVLGPVTTEVVPDVKPNVAPTSLSPVSKVEPAKGAPSDLGSDAKQPGPSPALNADDTDLLAPLTKEKKPAPKRKAPVAATIPKGASLLTREWMKTKLLFKRVETATPCESEGMAPWCQRYQDLEPMVEQAGNANDDELLGRVRDLRKGLEKRLAAAPVP